MNRNISVLGLGYVGLPLTVALAKNRKVIGFDVDQKRISDLKNFFDKNKEVSKDALKEISDNLLFTCKEDDLKSSDLYIITVPTPVDTNNKPDLSLIESASKIIGKYLQRGDIVVYESTVYPGATEEFCVPLLEKFSGLKFNIDFFCGYSPERINPGDKKHTIENVVKITSGSTPEAASIIDSIYKEITNNNTFQATSIKVAEAAKVIENTQRDINIALMNELSQIFLKLDIDTSEVLEAACTKWNFLDFKPGLVGGHCIGVDPYYLTYKAKKSGYNPKIILAGRETNDEMPNHVVRSILKTFSNNQKNIETSKILIIGATFKENCPDVRNSKVFDIIDLLNDHGCKLDLYDPEACWDKELSKYKNNIINELKPGEYDLILLAVPHDSVIKNGFEEIKKLGKKDFIFFDLKSIFPKHLSNFRL